MRRRLARPWLVAAGLFLAPGLASADDLAKNADLLRDASDFRVRTQAALALGASENQRAVEPLCRGVADSNRVVRIASASGLSRLRLGGAACIRRQIEREADATVKGALEKAFGTLERQLPPPGPPIGPGTRFYLAIDALAGPERLNAPVRAAFLRGLSGTEVAIAPPGETLEQATMLLARHSSIRGVQLAPRASKPVYEGGELKVKIAVAILSYPGKAIIGSFSINLAMQGVSAPDAKSEEELILSAAESAMRKFLQIVPTLDL
jgi:hypothetical protein